MIENMIEEVNDLHVKVYGESITTKEIEEKYNCRLNTLNIKSIINKLQNLHMQLMYPKYGLFNPDDL